MDTRKLSTHTALTAAAMAVVGLTGAGVLIGVLTPHGPGAVGPHPTLSGTLGDAGSILANNARVLAGPFLLIAFGFARSRSGRWIGDAIALLLVGANALSVGVELGRWQSRLVPYVPQLPIEWTALAMALSAWILARRHIDRRQLTGLAVASLVLVTAAAAVETWCTPHLNPQTAVHGRRVVTSGGSGLSRGSAVVSPSDFAPPTATRFKVARSLSLTSVRFRSASSGGAVWAHNNHQPPQGGPVT